MRACVAAGIRVYLSKGIPKFLSSLSPSTSVITSVGCSACAPWRSWSLYWRQRSPRAPRARYFNVKWPPAPPALRPAGKLLAAPECPGRQSQKAERPPLNKKLLTLPKLLRWNSVIITHQSSRIFLIDHKWFTSAEHCRRNWKKERKLMTTPFFGRGLKLFNPLNNTPWWIKFYSHHSLSLSLIVDWCLHMLWWLSIVSYIQQILGLKSLCSSE